VFGSSRDATAGTEGDRLKFVDTAVDLATRESSTERAK
jgi:hypothetical protein